jgi:hypothetical protein
MTLFMKPQFSQGYEYLICAIMMSIGIAVLLKLDLCYKTLNGIHVHVCE